jgi:DNA polymerase III delta prime subunit
MMTDSTTQTNYNEEKPISIDLLDELIIDKYKRILDHDNFIESTHNYNISLVKEIDTLTSNLIYYSHIPSKQSLNRYKHLMTKYISIKKNSITIEKCDKIISNIYANNSEDRKYLFKLLEYIMVSNIAENLTKYDYRVGGISINVTPRDCPPFKLGEYYIGRISLVTHPANNIIKVSIDGMKDTIVNSLFPYEFKVPLTKTGKHKLKGKATFRLNEYSEEMSLDFSSSYVVIGDNVAE